MGKDVALTPLRILTQTHHPLRDMRPRHRIPSSTIPLPIATKRVLEKNQTVSSPFFLLFFDTLIASPFLIFSLILDYHPTLDLFARLDHFAIRGIFANLDIFAILDLLASPKFFAILHLSEKLDLFTTIVSLSSP